MQWIGKVVKYMPFTTWYLIPEQARLQLCMTLPAPTTGTSVPSRQFQMTPARAKPPIAESTRIHTNSEHQIQDTLPVTGNLASWDYLNITAEYLAKTALTDALKEKEQKLDDIEAQKFKREQKRLKTQGCFQKRKTVQFIQTQQHEFGEWQCLFIDKQHAMKNKQALEEQ